MFSESAKLEISDNKTTRIQFQLLQNWNFSPLLSAIRDFVIAKKTTVTKCGHYIQRFLYIVAVVLFESNPF